MNDKWIHPPVLPPLAHLLAAVRSHRLSWRNTNSSWARWMDDGKKMEASGWGLWNLSDEKLTDLDSVKREREREREREMKNLLF